MFRKKGFNKKGMAVMWYLIEAVLISFVIILFFQYIQSVKDNTMFEKQFLSRDIALMIDTINSVPGVVIYNYEDDGKIKQFEYTFVDNKVQINKKDEQLEIKYHYYYNSQINNDYQNLLTPEKIMFAKTLSSTKVNSELSYVGSIESCSRVITKDEIHKIMVDYSDEELAFEFANHILNTKIGNLITSTRNKNPTIIDDRLLLINKDTPLVLSIKIGSDTDQTKNSIKIYYSQNNKEKSEKLACMINNNLKKNFSAMAIIQLPSNEKIINKNVDGIGILLEIGNDKIKDNELFKSKDKIMNHVIKAIGDYNE
jgi:hypothetical protein